MDRNNTDRDTLISAADNCAMFDRIARRYDIANRMISLGMDRGWRRETIRQLKPFRGGRYLDIGTGTGDLVFEILEQAPNVLIDAIDPSEKMLDVARKKAAHAGLGDAVSFFEADAMDLPMESETYDGIVSGFCLRNIENRKQALKEMCRVLKPGGQLIILEATSPSRRWVQWGYRCYRPLIPWIGRAVTGDAAYSYLVDSIGDFPAPDMIVEMIRSSGFDRVQFHPMALGSVSVFSGVK